MTTKDEVLDDLDRLTETIETLDWFSHQVKELPESKDNALMFSQLVLTKLYISEYMAHRVQGASPEQAVATTAKGELVIAQAVDRQRASMN